MISANTTWIELIPAGTFFTNDERGPFFNTDPQSVVRLSKQVMAGGLPIDFDHAIDRAAPQGLPAPAAGWIRDLRVVAGAIQGRVEWTVRGAAAVKAKEYRFISPVFNFDPLKAGDQSGRVVQIRRAALTNNPALSDLPAIAASRQTAQLTNLSEEDRKFCWLTGMSAPALMAARAKHEQTILASRMEAAALRAQFGPARISVTELCARSR